MDQVKKQEKADSSQNGGMEKLEPPKDLDLGSLLTTPGPQLSPPGICLTLESLSRPDSSLALLHTLKPFFLGGGSNVSVTLIHYF